LSSLFNQMLRYGSGRARLFRKHPREGLPGALMLGFPPLLVIASGIFSPFSRTALTLFLCLVLVYVTVVVVTSTAQSVRKGFGHLPAIAFAFVVIHSGLMAGFWTGLYGGLRKSAPSVSTESK
jgi:hypothetical protein